MKAVVDNQTGGACSACEIFQRYASDGAPALSEQDAVCSLLQFCAQYRAFFSLASWLLAVKILSFYFPFTLVTGKEQKEPQTTSCQLLFLVLPWKLYPSFSVPLLLIYSKPITWSFTSLLSY